MGLVLQHGLADYQKSDYRDWIVKHAGQVVLLVSQINFNKNIVTCLTSPQPHDSLKDYLSDHIRAINTVTEVATKETINHKLLTAEALLIIEVHARDILTNLIENKVRLYIRFSIYKIILNNSYRLKDFKH